MTQENPSDTTGGEAPAPTLSPSLDLLSRTLDAFGADRSRWPAGREAALAHELASSDVARRLVQEAEALDLLLSQADATATRALSRPGQCDAIVAAALAHRPAATAIGVPAVEGRLIDLATHRRSRAPASRPSGEISGSASGRIGEHEADRERSPGTLRRALTLLAASLMLGVLVGASDLGSTTLLEFGEALGVANGVESSIAQVDGDGLEDLL